MNLLEMIESLNNLNFHFKHYKNKNKINSKMGRDEKRKRDEKGGEHLDIGQEMVLNLVVKFV